MSFIDDIGKSRERDDRNASMDMIVSHARDLYKAGIISKAVLRDVEKQATREYIDRLDVETFGELMDNGRLDELQEFAGYEKGEDFHEVDQRRNASVAKVVANFAASAAKTGAISAQDALDTVRRYVRVADDVDPDEAVAKLLGDTLVEDGLQPPEPEIPAWAREEAPDPESPFSKPQAEDQNAELDKYLAATYGGEAA